MLKRNAILLSVLLLALLTLGSAVLAQDQTFFGKTAQDLFPDAASDTERDNAFAALLAANIPDGHDRFEGQTLTIATLGQGARGGISGTYYFWRPAFEAATGATLNIVEVPIDQLATTIPADFLTEQHTYDLIVTFSYYYGDLVSNGWIQPIDPFLGQEGFAQWDPNDMAPAMQNLYTWGGQWYGARNDGDAQLLYYRKDILEDPAWQQQYEDEVGSPMPYPIQTWQDLLAITTFFNGKDWNADGDPDDGISLHLKVGGQGMFHFMTLAAPFSITPADGDDPTVVTKHDNVFWFDPDTMDPLINQPGQVMALEFLQQLAATGQEAQFGWDLGQAWDNFLTGNAIATFSWGDVGTLAEKPDRSTIIGNLGAAKIPCSSVWYDSETQETVTDTENPNCVGNTTGGSWHPVMSAYAHNPELAYFLMSMIATQPINFFDVTTGWQGIDPSSLSSLFPPMGTASVDDYVAMGYNADDVQQYITAYGSNLFDPPIFETYLRIPGTPAYINSLDIHLSEAMTGQHTSQEALDLVASEWNQTTDDYGRDDLKAIYQESIGYTP